MWRLTSSARVALAFSLLCALLAGGPARAQALRPTPESALGPITGADLSADERTLATVGVDGALRLWDTETGRLLRQLPLGETLPLHSHGYEQPGTGLVGVPLDVALSPDGRLAAVAPQEAAVEVWVLDTELGAPVDTVFPTSRTTREGGPAPQPGVLDLSGTYNYVCTGGGWGFDPRTTLDISEDGRHLLVSNRGVWRLRDGANVIDAYLDAALPGDVARFDPEGGVVGARVSRWCPTAGLYRHATAVNGPNEVRWWGRGLNLLASAPLEYDEQLNALALSPDGALFARAVVTAPGRGAEGKEREGLPLTVIVASQEGDLSQLRFPTLALDGAPLLMGWLGRYQQALAFSVDSAWLFGAGGRDGTGAYPVLRWAVAGGAPEVLTHTPTQPQELLPLRDGRLLVLEVSGAWQLLSAEGETLVRVEGASAPLGFARAALWLSEDGRAVVLGDGETAFSVAALDWVGPGEVGDLAPPAPAPEPGFGTAVARAASSSAGVEVLAMPDGTLRWRRLRDEVELFTLLLHPDGRWVAWTPSGLYAASIGGDELFGFVLEERATPTVIPASRLGSARHQPEVIARLVETLDEAEASALAGRAHPGALGAGTLPPVVERLELRREGDTLALDLDLAHPPGAPVEALRVLVDGRPVEVSEDEGRLTLPAPAPGARVSVLARNRYGWGPATTRISADAQGAVEPAVDPKLYVLAIGVSAYADETRALRYAAQDAEDFAALMQQAGARMYRGVEVRVVTNAQATRAGVLDGLAWLRRSATQHDVAMVLLSGHGVNDPDGRYYFMPTDGEQASMAVTMVSEEDVRRALAAIPGKVLLFLDTCHAGGVADDDLRGVGALRVEGFVNELRAAENGVVVFTSSAGRQVSVEDARWENGAFTEALLEGLGGAADYGDTGRVTLNMLDLYLSERVKELTDGAQTPTTAKPWALRDFPLVEL